MVSHDTVAGAKASAQRIADQLDLIQRNLEYICQVAHYEVQALCLAVNDQRAGLVQIRQCRAGLTRISVCFPFMLNETIIFISTPP